MKNGNLYKLVALSMALVLISAMSFAQNKKDEKTTKKQKRIIITKTIDEDGESTDIDTLIFEMPHIEMDEILEELILPEDEIREIHMQIEAEMDEAARAFRFEFDDRSDDLKEAMEELKSELKALDIESDAQKRIEEAMEKLEEAGKYSSTHMKRFVLGEDHPVFVGEDGKIKVITKENGKDVETKVIWFGDDVDMSTGEEKELKVWVDSDKDRRVIIKSDGKIVEDENIFVIKETDASGKNLTIDIDGADMTLLTSSKEKDLDKAIDAGLPIDKDKMFEEMNLTIEIIDDQDPVFLIKTEVEGNLKATAYTEDFKKLKKLKVTEKDDKNALHLDMNELKESGATYILLEQGGKTDLMKIHK